MLLLISAIIITFIIGGLILSNEIQKLKSDIKELSDDVRSLESIVNGELERIDEAMDGLFLKREEDLKKFDNMPLAEKAKHARTKFNKKK